MSEPVVEGFRLSPQQRALWRLQQEGPELRVHATVELRGALDARRLEDALRRVVARHDILRTRFHRPGGVKLPLQVVDENGRVPLEVPEEIEDLAAGGLEAGLHRLLARRAERAAPEEGHPLRSLLVRGGADRHLLALSLPALCADLRTLDNLVRELGLAYGEAPLEPPVEDLVQYVEFAEWRHYLLTETDEGEEGRRFWEELRSATTPFELPFQHANGHPGVPRPAHARRTVDPEILQAVEEGARRWDVDDECVLLAAWKSLLFRLAGSSDMELGRIVDGRTQDELLPSLGPFAQWLPLPCRLPDEARFGELPARVRRTLEQTAGWLEYFEQDPAPRTTRGNGAPTVGFELCRWPESYPAGDLVLRLEDWEVPRDPFRLKLLAVLRGRELFLELQHDADELSRDDARGLLASLEALLGDGLRHPDRRVGELALLSTGEPAAPPEPGRTEARPDLDRGVHELFADGARRHPDRVAAVCGGEALTFGALAERSHRLAGWLRRHGVGAEIPVALVLDKEPSMVVAVLAVLEAGGFYVPVDPGVPEGYRRRMLDLVDPAVVLTTTRVDLGPAGAGRPVLRLDTEWEHVESGRGETPAAPTSGDQLAYVIFTSGSTGEPKGVAVAHRQLLHYVEAIRSRLDLRPGTRFGLLSSFAADLGNTSLFPALCGGGTLHLVRDERAVDPELAVADLRREPVDLLKIAPSHLEALLTASQPHAALPRRQLVLGGEALRWDLVDRVAELAPACSLVNHYGPTETTVGVLTRSVEPEAPRPGPPPLGRPLDDVRAYVVDPRLQAVPRWIPGELAVGGAAPARGYLRDARRTAERFVPDPFAAGAGARIYRTGDRARLLPTGEIDFLGRVDEQVKIRGHRVEPAEVVRQVRSFPGVENAAVVTRLDEHGVPALVAYVVSFADPRPTEGDLRSHLRDHLPDPMVPARFVFLDALPLTPSGKVDRTALPEPDWSRRSADVALVPPRNPLEEVLAGIWEDLLGVERAGIHDDFFALGGHSLLATQLLARVRRILQVEIPLRSLFDAPTVAGLASTIEAARASGGAGPAPPIEPVPRDGRVLPLSFSQQRVWFIERWEVDNAAYNVAHGVDLEGRLDLAALRRAFQEIVRRHESLRTVFPCHDGEPRQEILPPFEVPLPVVDLSGLEPELRSRVATELTDGEGEGIVDLERGPLLRLRLLRMDPEDHRLVTVVHLMAVDGWSLGVFIREIGTLYNAFLADRPSPLPELPIQYADFAYWQRRWMDGEVLEAHVDFWRGQFGDRLPVLELPTDRPRPKIQTFRGHRITADYPPELTARLKDLTRHEGATLFVVLLAALKILLFRYTGQDDILVGSPTANRNRPELEDLIGLVVSTLVLRSDLSGDPTVREVLARVREVTLGAYDHPHVPLEHILRHLEPNKDLSHAPVFQVLFVLQNMPIPNLELEGLESRLVPVANQTAKFDLEVNVWDNPDGLSLAIEYNTDVFHEEMVLRMLDHYRRLLEAVADAPGHRLSEISFLTDGERRQLLEWSGGAAAATENAPVHHLFRDRARRAPDAVALEDGRDHVTFRELEARAGRLARHLAAGGVGPGDLVAVFLDRRAELATALLGVLEAGAAYLPLGTDLPPSRVEAVLEEARPQLVLTTADRARNLPGSGTAVVSLGPGGAPPAGPEDLQEGTPRVPVPPDAPAYVIYTSGSTGRPKGVVVPHHALANHAAEIVRRFELSPRDRVLQFASPSFDVAAEELFPTWAAGATLVLQPGRLPSGLGDFEELVAARRLTVMNLPASYWHEWVGEARRAGSPVPRSLRLLVLGSEPVHTDRLYDWLALPGSRQVRSLNAYGVSEATVTSTLYAPRDEPGRVAWSTLPVGGPLGGVRTHVLDPALRLTPRGVPGELCIAGEGLARGYLGDPRSTAERFVPDPFATPCGGRLYRTGDRARWLAGGDLQLLGRLDDQLKIRGFRIEPGDVEAALAQAPGVREAAVVADADREGKSPLRAFVVETEGDAVDPAELQELLRRRLPLYMLPGSIAVVPDLPRTPSGKVDRRELLASADRSSGVRAGHRSPRTFMERLIAAVWCDLLDLDRVGVDEDFFILGGHSMLATRALARLEALLGIDIPLPTFFEAPTLATLAPVLESLVRARLEAAEALGAAGNGGLDGSRQPFAGAEAEKRHSARGRRCFDLDPETAARLAVASRSRALPVDALAAAALAGAVAATTGIEDLALGTLAPVGPPEAAEDRAPTAPPTHLVVLRARLGDAPSFSALAARLRDELVEAGTVGKLPVTPRAADAEGTAWAPTVVLTIGAPAESDPAPDGDAAPPEPIPTLATAAFHLHLAQDHDRGSLVATWDPKRVTGESPDRLFEGFLRLLSRGLDEPDAPITQLMEGAPT